MVWRKLMTGFTLNCLCCWLTFIFFFLLQNLFSLSMFVSSMPSILARLVSCMSLTNRLARVFYHNITWQWHLISCSSVKQHRLRLSRLSFKDTSCSLHTTCTFCCQLSGDNFWWARRDTVLCFSPAYCRWPSVLRDSPQYLAVGKAHKEMAMLPCKPIQDTASPLSFTFISLTSLLKQQYYFLGGKGVVVWSVEGGKRELRCLLST